MGVWFNYYSSLLGTEPDVESPDEDIPSVFGDLEISEEPFTTAEYARVKAGLKGGGMAPISIFVIFARLLQPRAHFSTKFTKLSIVW